jgi:hypothetical protein
LRAAGNYEACKLLKIRKRSRGHESPRAPIAALKLDQNFSFTRQYLGLFPFRWAEQSANPCQRPRSASLGSLEWIVAVTLNEAGSGVIGIDDNTAPNASPIDRSIRPNLRPHHRIFISNNLRWQK